MREFASSVIFAEMRYCMSKIREIIKKNHIAVEIYENIIHMKTYIEVWGNSVKRRKRFSEKDRLKVQKYKDIHKGKRCFIVATGPSQNVSDLDMLKNEITFTVNYGYKAYRQTKWRATYYVVMDDNAGNVLREALSDTHEYEGVFCSPEIYDYIPNGKETMLVTDAKDLFMIDTVWNKLFPNLFPIARFSDDISKKVYCGKTVIYSCIQIAAYMGFSEIYLTGVDCNYHGKKQHADIMASHEISEEKKLRLGKAGDDMLKQFGALAEVLKKKNIHVYNATRGGSLEAFPRVDLDKLFLT